MTSEETRARMRAAKLGKPRTPQARAAIAAGMLAHYGVQSRTWDDPFYRKLRQRHGYTREEALRAIGREDLSDA